MGELIACGMGSQSDQAREETIVGSMKRAMEVLGEYGFPVSVGSLDLDGKRWETTIVMDHEGFDDAVKDGLARSLADEVLIVKVGGSMPEVPDRQPFDPAPGMPEHWTFVAERGPPPHAVYRVWDPATATSFDATPCYGMHEPWWVPRNGATREESDPVPMKETHSWARLPGPPPPSDVILDHPRFVGLWTYRQRSGRRRFCASVLVDGEVQETAIHGTWAEALGEAAEILKESDRAGWPPHDYSGSSVLPRVDQEIEYDDEAL